MKILVVGGGGREHALAWALSKSPQASEVLGAPGNGGTQGTWNGTHIRSVSVGASDIDGLVGLAEKEAVGLVVVGPEAPLADGLADQLSERGVPCSRWPTPKGVCTLAAPTVRSPAPPYD